MRFFTRLFAFIFFSGVLLNACAVELPVYKWRPNEVLRFDFSKTVEIVESAPAWNKVVQAPPDPIRRSFSFSGVMIIEVHKIKTTPAQIGVLRFDSVRIDIPESFWFSSQSDEIKLQQDKDKSIERAIEGAVKAARWNVQLGTDGVIRIDSRTPKSVDEWLRETGHAAIWRRKFNKAWAEIIDKNVGLGASGVDRDVLLVLPGAEPAAASATEMDKIRPERSTPVMTAFKESKGTFAFTRVAPPRIGQAFDIPGIGTIPVSMTLKPEIVTIKGTCLFDAYLGQPDFVSEEYSFKLDYKCSVPNAATYTLSQDVTVKYELKRLAPKIDTYLDSNELPPVIPVVPTPK